MSELERWLTWTQDRVNDLLNVLERIADELGRIADASEQEVEGDE
jgi:hypothetical protein